MYSPSFGFGSSLGGWSSATTATTSNFVNLGTTNNKPTTNTSLSSFGSVTNPPVPSLFGATTTSATTTTKSGNFKVTYFLKMIIFSLKNE